jgi:hypothetical protein
MKEFVWTISYIQSCHTAREFHIIHSSIHIINSLVEAKWSHKFYPLGFILASLSGILIQVRSLFPCITDTCFVIYKVQYCHKHVLGEIEFPTCSKNVALVMHLRLTKMHIVRYPEAYIVLCFACNFQQSYTQDFSALDLIERPDRRLL